MKRKPIVLLSLLCVASVALAAKKEPSPDHRALDDALSTSIQWAERLDKELRKSEPLNQAAALDGVANTRMSLDASKKAYERLASQGVSETAEAHFAAVATHQANAESDLKSLDAELKKEKPDLKSAKKTARKLVQELEDAKREHAKELHEIEAKASSGG